MPTKILDFELPQVPERLAGLAGYTDAFVLLRWEGRPVASVVVPLHKGTFKKADLRERMNTGLGENLRACWLRVLLPPTAGKRKPFRAAVTIAVCTRNRPDDLRKCLASLLSLPEEGQEILVVDNCPPNDATERVVRDFPGVNYVREDQVGLNRARNRALRQARGEIVAFIDDDAVADKNWLRALTEAFAEPLTLSVTGLTLPIELETEAQEEFERIGAFERGFRRRRFSIETICAAGGGAAGAGVNMAFRRDVMEKAGLFDEALDAGTATHSGGDTEMLCRIIGAGYDVIYEPAALNWHRHRRTRPELIHAVFGYGVGLYAAWIRCFWAGKERDAWGTAWSWLFKVRLRGALRAIWQRPGAYPRDLAWAELKGSLWGPIAYGLAKQELAQGDSQKE
jgi:GT2 family glycosyltransferase